MTPTSKKKGEEQLKYFKTEYFRLKPLDFLIRQTEVRGLCFPFQEWQLHGKTCPGAKDYLLEHLEANLYPQGLQSQESLMPLPQEKGLRPTL